MPSRNSAGLLLYRLNNGKVEVLLGHPGGPYWSNRDVGAWTIPKGEIEEGEDPLHAAVRECQEETGQAKTGPFQSLTPLRQPGGKLVHAWAVETDFSAADLKSGTFPLEWPPRSGKFIDVPELDRVEWFSIDEARYRILKGQVPFLDELALVVNSSR